ncbi:hypothetical protein KAR52_01010 [Candidatus Pacearchaeota archaeon]|nr:hypothetical protein [Candidatus Pacearchaeota archaeon]
MKLEILSLNEALNYLPTEKTYVIRIFDSLQQMPITNLIENDNWGEIKEYFFDDFWPKDWKEYSWIDTDDPYFSGALSITWEEMHKTYPKMTKESLMGYFESIGWPEGRYTLFDENNAKKILNDYEQFGKGVDNIIVHCRKGENRSPAVGIAMNEIYDWGIKGLKEKFPNHRRFVYKKMKDVAEIK